MPESAARASSLAKLLLETTAAILVASSLVTPALGFGKNHSERPDLPIGLTVTRATQTAIEWTWNPGGESTVGFRLFRDGRLVEQTTKTATVFDGLQCGHAYLLGVEAVDGHGGRSKPALATAASAPCERPVAAAPSPLPAPSSSPAPEPAPRAEAAPSPALDPTEAAPNTDPPDPDLGEVPTADPAPSLWQTGGAFVWHETAIDPEQLGRELRANGFGWIAVQLHDGLTVDPVEDDWLRRFREASGGLPVGGWGVLRTDPEDEAKLASSLLDRYPLGFYIADAEAEYKFSGDDGQSDVRYRRSREFVDTFRALRPDLPAAISSYCRADRADIDWETWASAGFDFMPQAYVNDFGDAATPAACAEGAASFFPSNTVHPTIGMYSGQEETTSAETYASMLEAAHTVGFSVYLAETHPASLGWNVLGKAITDHGIATAFTPDQTAEQPARGSS
jgi:hypothetical protein